MRWAGMWAHRHQELNCDRLSTRRNWLPVLSVRPASSSRRARTCALSVLPRAIGNRRHVGLIEHFVRLLLRETVRAESRRLTFRIRLAFRHHRRIQTFRMGPVVGPVHDVLVGPVEIESIDSAWRAPVLELVTPCLDGARPLRAQRGVSSGSTFHLSASILETPKIVTCRPGTRREFLAEQIVFAVKPSKPSSRSR